jgi:hypothetical protein
MTPTPYFLFAFCFLMSCADGEQFRRRNVIAVLLILDALS